MKGNKKYNKQNVQYSIFLFIFFLSNVCYSQDLHFTQYNNAPLLVNPANTGFSHFYDYRIGINNRTQWAGTNTPYKTFSAWGDAQLFAKKMDNGWLGLGGILLNDVAGTGNLKSIKAYLNVAYHQMIDDRSVASVGIGAGMVQKRIDPEKLVFDDQWNGKFFDVDNTLGKDVFPNTSSSYIDLNIGLNYSLYANDNFYFNCGVSMMHLNRPEETFFTTSTISPKIDPRYNAFINATFKVTDDLIISPVANYSVKKNTNQIVVGFNGQYNLSGEGGKTQLLFGGYYRHDDAFAPAVGFQLGNLQAIVNYDITTSSLSSFTAYKNTYELSLLWNGLYNTLDKGAKAMRCQAPRF